MRQKLEKFALLRDMWKALAILLIILWVCGMLLFFTLESISPPGRRTAQVPEITFHNVGPCLGFDQDLVEKFEEGDEQYICADMTTDESPVFLELYVFKSENNNQVYVDGATLESGPIAFAISPPLPPGKYWATIRWARTTLVDFEFEIAEKANK